MSEIANASINTFGRASPEADVPPEDPILEIPSSMLQELLGAIQELKDEVAQLREERDQDRQDIAALRESVASLVSTQEQDTNRICLDIAYDRRRITKLETPAPTVPSSKVTSHLDEIAKALLAREKPRDFMTFWDVEELLDLSHRRVSQLAEIAANDPRFVIGWHPRKKNTKVIRLNSFNIGELAAQLHNIMKGE